jgi:hypothetical protein
MDESMLKRETVIMHFTAENKPDYATSIHQKSAKNGGR